ncbi:MAG: amino acid ABC transporter permease [Peptoniphilus sp.]|nr:amino acid ABC transporter permease [Peptoniphilus sp.]MDD7362876.1 amino acid ABC transporter permease [Bacillota bacterium]MDY6044883.1 amino acid ABC transporter permease [Peptoniphilus sp.]
MDILQRFIPLFLEGMKTTASVFAMTLIVSSLLCIPVAWARLSRNLIISKIAEIYIYIMRATPLLLQLMFVFFGLPLLPIPVTLGRFTSIFIAFILNYTAYFAEILRGGIQSVDPGQWEAGKVLGLSKVYTFFKVILPVVIERSFPAFSNEVITLVKDTSLVYILGVMDILKAAKSVSNTMSSILPYIYVGIVYLIIVGILSVVLNRMERKIQAS